MIKKSKAIPVIILTMLLLSACDNSSNSSSQSGNLNTQTDIAPENTINEGVEKINTKAPTETEVEPISVEIEEIERNCIVLDDFNPEERRWFVVNDTVMGGQSSSTINHTDGTLNFSGTIVTDGGGFASIRRSLESGALDGYSSAIIRFKSDGRGYALTFRDRGGRSITHRQFLGKEVSDQWVEEEVFFAELIPTFFGQPTNADPFNISEAREMGIILNEAVDGPFAIEIDSIKACE